MIRKNVLDVEKMVVGDEHGKRKINSMMTTESIMELIEKKL